METERCRSPGQPSFSAEWPDVSARISRQEFHCELQSCLEALVDLHSHGNQAHSQVCSVNCMLGAAGKAALREPLHADDFVVDLQATCNEAASRAGSDASLLFDHALASRHLAPRVWDDVRAQQWMGL